MVGDIDKIRVCICGGGNGAHVMAGLAASRPGVEARVLTLYADEAERWTSAMKAEGRFSVCFNRGGSDGEDAALQVRPFVVSKDPAEVVPGAHIVVFVVPAFAHKQYLEAIKPHVDAGATIVGMPGRSGFEFQLRAILKENANLCTVFVLASLPWACRIKEFGKSVTVLETKASLEGAVQPAMNQPVYANDHMASFQYLLGKGPKLITKGHLLGMTLMTPGPYIHPTLMYGHWKNWDGKPLAEPPLFYQGISDETGELLDACSREIVATAKRIMERVPGVDLTTVIPIYDWFMNSYSEKVTDKSSMATAMRTNKGYEGLKHPMTQTDDGKYLPDFMYRYLTEDVAHGLVVIKGIADIAGIETPSIDEVLYWGQARLGKEFIVNGRLVGKDVKDTRTPQGLGLNTLNEILLIK